MFCPRVACALVYTPSHTEREPAPRQQKIEKHPIKTRARCMKTGRPPQTGRGSIQESARGFKDVSKSLSIMNQPADGRSLLLIPILCATLVHAQALDF